MSAAVISYPHDLKHEKIHPMKFLDQLKLQAFRRFQEESCLYEDILKGHVLALEALVDQSKDGMAIIMGSSIFGRESKIQYLNEAFTRITGYTAEQIVGRSPVVMQDILGDIRCFLHKEDGLTESVSKTVEIKSLTDVGMKSWVEFTVTPLRDEEERISRWIYTLRDITGQRHAMLLDGRLKKVQAENSRLVIELEKQKIIELELSHSAFHDGLTGLRNRRYFLDRLAEALARTKKRSSYRAAVIYLDLDGFKVVNDTVGHRGGDRVLFDTSRRLEKCCRTQDVIARLGGDEFAILIDDVTAERGAFVVQRILDSLASPYDLGDELVSLTPSIGFCTVESGYTDVEDIVRAADSAMYLAKRRGGARCVYSDASFDASLSRAKSQEQELRKGIESSELRVYYQPILDISTTPPKLLGVEALVRWQHPHHGLLSPAQFFPLAERHGLIPSLGISSFRIACFQMKLWQSCVMNPDFFLSVNISRSQLNNPGFFKDIVEILADTAVDARCIQLELTEESMTQITEIAMDAISKMRKLGIKIALDKFGTGSAPMTQLEEYPIDSVKFDRSLIKRLGGNSEDSQMPKLIMAFVQGLGIDLTAGQVESDAEIKSLRQLGFTRVQGNAFSPAVEEAKISRLLEEGMQSLKIRNAETWDNR